MVAHWTLQLRVEKNCRLKHENMSKAVKLLPGIISNIKISKNVLNLIHLIHAGLVAEGLQGNL